MTSGGRSGRSPSPCRSPAGATGGRSRSRSCWPPCLELVDRRHPSRSLVDLIFFPTGGGKTEAYLGAAAISLLARRLRDPQDAGTDAIMRYTLRLLTAQQFLRAAALACVLEDIRSRNEEELGSAPFSIGIWLGSASTPNRWTSRAGQPQEAAAQCERTESVPAAALPVVRYRDGAEAPQRAEARRPSATC